MARIRPFRRLEIDSEICKKVSKIMAEKRYRGSFTSFVESVLDQYTDGLLVDKGRTDRAEFVGFEEKKQDHEKQRIKRAAAS